VPSAANTRSFRPFHASLLREASSGSAGLVVADEDAPVLVDLQAVRPAVILANEVAVSVRRQLEDAAERDVDEVEIAVAVERGAFEEAVHFGIGAVGVGPGRPALLPPLLGQLIVNLGDQPLHRIEKEHRNTPLEGSVGGPPAEKELFLIWPRC
jgi:hypothetical protein